MSVNSLSLSQEEQDRLLQTAGSLEPAPEGLSRMKVVSDPRLGAVKVRAYATEAEARNMERILQQLDRRVATPSLLARKNELLFFQYLDIDADSQAAPGPETFTRIGRFLGTLNSIRATEMRLEDLDAEFEAWMVRFQAMDILPAQASAQAVAAYKKIRPADLPLCLDYWDAMPHNFGWSQGELYLLDEKHLRPSYPGVGLVKPCFALTKDSWESVQAGYQEITSLDSFTEHREFLTYYYLAAALYFYSLLGAAGRAALTRNRRYLEYREMFIRRATGGSRTRALAAELQLLRANPADRGFLLRRRAGLIKAALQGGGRPGLPDSDQEPL